MRHYYDAEHIVELLSMKVEIDDKPGVLFHELMKKMEGILGTTYVYTMNTAVSFMNRCG